MSDDEFSDLEIDEHLLEQRRLHNESPPLHVPTNWVLESMDSPVIQQYHGELMPKFLHAAFDFASTFANTFKGSEPVQQVIRLLAPKLVEFAGYRRFKLDRFHYEALSNIGNGRFGDVWRMNFGSGGKQVAVKQFKDLTYPPAIFKEVHTLIAVQHKRVVQLLGAFHESGYGTNMVMQLCLGSLRTNLGALTPLQMVRFSIQLLEALQYIHSMNIIHCDVRPDNCLITKVNNVVLADFGDAQLLPPSAKFVRLHDHSLQLGNKGYCDDGANLGIYSKSTDMFGLGCTLFEMEAGCALVAYENWPDAPRFEYIRVVQEGRLLHYPPEHYPDARNATSAWNFDGERQTLLCRCTSAPMFCSILKDMVYHSCKRIGAADILLKYRALFDHLLTSRGMTMDRIDEDFDTKDVRLVVDNFQNMGPVSFNDELNVAMDLIYYDHELNIQDSKTEKVTEQTNKDFDGIPTKDLKFVFEKMLSGKSVRVYESGDGLVLPNSSGYESSPLQTTPNSLHPLKTLLKNFQTTTAIQDSEKKKSFADSAITEAKNVKEPIQSLNAAANLNESDTENVMEPHPKYKKCLLNSGQVRSEIVSKTHNAKTSLGSSSTFEQSSSTEVFEQSSSTEVFEQFTPPSKRQNTPANKAVLRNDPVCKSTSCNSTTTDESVKEQSGISKPVKQNMDSSSSEDDVNDAGKNCNKGKKQENFMPAYLLRTLYFDSRVWLKTIGKEPEYQDSKIASTNCDEKNCKYWYIRHGKPVPLELRGVAPPPKNLPFGFRAENDWAGWFDCSYCDEYYTHDYDKIWEHLGRCYKKK